MTGKVRSKIHPIIKALQKVEHKAIKENYWFALKPINEAINEIGEKLAMINEGKCKGWM